MLLLVADIDWNGLLQLRPELLPVLAMFATGAAVGMTAIIATQWRKAQQASNDARLKERMIERGFTADEIERVMNAGTSRGRFGKSASPHDRPECSVL
jgi:hypothetical protein